LTYVPSGIERDRDNRIIDILQMGGYGYKTFWDGDICCNGQG